MLLISNNVGEEMADAAVAAQDAGIKVVTWDSPIASGNGEDVFIAQVDFDETGTVMADMALNILPDGGQMAVLSAKPESPNQNAWIAAMEEALKDSKYAGIELVEIVYGNDNIADSEAAAIGLIDQWPDLGLIMAPTTEGIKAAAKVVTDDSLCDQIEDLRPGPALGDGVLHPRRLCARVRPVVLRRPGLPGLLRRLSPLDRRHRRRSRRDL